MIINTNMAALNTVRQLGINEKNTQSALAKLSSGFRINSAADDAAGLAISEKMRGQISGLNKASSNAQDGISMVATAEGSLNETTSILQRMRELAVQGSNDTNTTTDRTAIQTEMNQLTSEINRIGNTTEFNTQKLLKGINSPVVTTAQTVDTTTAGIKGVPVGATSALVTNSSSVVAIKSTATVQGNTAAATGRVGVTDQTTVSVKGANSSIVISGLTFTSTTLSSDDPNGITININQLANATGTANTITKSGTGSNTIINFNIGTDADGKSLFTGINRGDLTNFLKGIDGYDTSGVTISVPIAPNADGSSSAESLVNMPNQNQVATAATVYTGKLTGGVDEVSGASTFSITAPIKEAGDTITVGGKTFTAVTSGANAANGEFNISAIQGASTANRDVNLTRDMTSGKSNTAPIWAAAAATVGATAAGTATVVFNGVTVTINAAAADATHTSTTGTVQAGATGTAVTVNTLTTGASAQDTVNAIVAGLNAAKTAGGATGPLANFTFSGGAATLTITGDGSQGVSLNTQGITVNAGTTGLANLVTTVAPSTPGVGTSPTVGLTQAAWNTGAITAMTANDTSTVTFQGVTITLADNNGGTAVGALSAVSGSGATISLDGTSTANAVSALVTAFQAVQTAQGAGGSLANFTFKSTNAGAQFEIDGNGSQGTSLNAVGMTIAGGGSLAFTTGTAAATTLGLADTFDISVGGTTYSLKNADLAKFDGSLTKEQAANIVKSATNSSGIALSTVADVSFDATGKLNVVSKAGGAGSDVQILGTTAGNADDANIDALFGTASASTDIAGADIGATADDQARSLRVAINANTTLGTHYTAAGTANDGEIIMTENANQATATPLAAVTTAGAGANDKLTITDLSGKNLSQVTIVRGTGLPVAGSNAVTTAVDSMVLTSGTKSTELNGVKIAFSGLTSGTATTLNTTWDAANQTLNVTGTILGSETAAGFSAAFLAAAKTGLINAGFQGGTNLILTTPSTASGATNIAAAMNGNSMAFSGGATTIAAHAMAIDQKNGNLTITLSDTTPNSNTAAKIQAAVQALGTVKSSSGDVNFAKYQFTAEGNWDTKATGENIIKANTSLVGGTKEVKGDYSFDITKAFAVGDKVNVKGQVFTAVASGAIGSRNEFDVAGGDINNQAISLRNAIGLNSTLSATYTTTGTGATIKMTELQATGTDLKATDEKVTATGTPGQYSVNISSLLTDGAAFELDGQKITASDDVANTGYADGTAFKVAADAASQTTAIANAINANATLNKVYTASVDSTTGSLVLTQTDDAASETAPSVQTLSSAKGDFKATLQIGANTGQTMTVSIKDMRSLALGISGTDSGAQLTASNGAVATLTTVASASNGSDNNNVEYTLDISTAEKATAAISIIDDATARVSAERSNLGAIQNRLEHTINNLGTSSQNVTTAEANIRDVDMAKEMTNFQKNNILQQAAQAMLAQANQQGQGVLQLLR